MDYTTKYCGGAARARIPTVNKLMTIITLAAMQAGVNDEDVSLDSPEHIISAASCTTNAIVPVIKILDDAFGE